LEAGTVPEGSHELVVAFRGHEARAAVPIYSQQPPITLAWRVESPGDASIRVEAEPRPARIVFVLDCSGSVGNNLRDAKETLLSVLRDKRVLTDRVEIAVILFGHRVEYADSRRDQRSEWLTSHPVNPAPRPYDDVELVLPLTRASDQVIS